MDDWKEKYASVDWMFLWKQKNKVFLVELEFNETGGKSIREIGEEHRIELLQLNTYVTYNVNKYKGEGFISRYYILDKAVDENNNLILFAKRDNLGF